FTVIFNFPKEEIYLKKNSQFKKKFHYNLSGLTVKAKGSRLNVFEITEVRQKSVADRAGVLTGDVLLSVNGVNTRALDLNAINGFFNHKPGKKINLVVDRNGQQLRFSFRLTDQI